MKIAVLAHLKYPIGQPYAGGLEMHTHLLTVALKRHGHDVTLFASRGSDPALDPVMLCDPTGDALLDPDREEAIDRAEHEAYRRMMEMLRPGASIWSTTIPCTRCRCARAPGSASPG